MERPRPCSKCHAKPLGYGVDYNIIFKDAMGYAYQCPKCNKGTEWFKSETEACAAWNEMNKNAP